jgi:hypothetical protein
MPKFRSFCFCHGRPLLASRVYFHPCAGNPAYAGLSSKYGGNYPGECTVSLLSTSHLIFCQLVASLTHLKSGFTFVPRYLYCRTSRAQCVGNGDDGTGAVCGGDVQEVGVVGGQLGWAELHSIPSVGGLVGASGGEGDLSTLAACGS